MSQLELEPLLVGSKAGFSAQSPLVPPIPPLCPGPRSQGVRLTGARARGSPRILCLLRVKFLVMSDRGPVAETEWSSETRLQQGMGPNEQVKHWG